ncbi:hypothetical protein R4Z09_27795 [Niallia oryzisoli]|uniref:Uncharacterized protein n=1 Tax=Niallia oryzisoli TaxID=1737571 RepID=A0ABZ2CG75_9BACI
MKKGGIIILIEMSRQLFDSLEDYHLVRACFDPIIPMIRGKDASVKEQVYHQLNTSQQALFLFNAYYNHACHSTEEMYWWSAYYFAQPKTWQEIKGALKYFKAAEMHDLLEKVESTFITRDYPKKLEQFSIAYNDLEKDIELFQIFQEHNNHFQEISPATLKQIGLYIRKNPNEFIRLV